MEKNIVAEENKKEILLVENDKFSIELTKKIISDLCKIDHTSDGLSAVTLAGLKNYSVILMDINLGLGIDGLDAAQQIRKLPGYDNTPIVAMTAYALKGDREEFLSKGCSHYISKPINIKEFYNLVKELLDY